MSIDSYVIKLHRKRIITEKPHPIWPFILFLIILLLLIPAIVLAAGTAIIIFIILLAFFTLIFAVLHLVVYLIIKRK